MERRKPSLSKASALPQDYLKMMNDVFNNHFQTSLESFNKLKPGAHFESHGEIFSDEILLAISLVSDNNLAATTVYASADFDPKASLPNVPDLLSAGVDAIATVFSDILPVDDMNALKAVADDSLSALQNVPFIWTEIESNKKKLFVKIDKANLKIDEMADQWLETHDPEKKEREEEEARATEELFVTGAKAKRGEQGE